MRESRHLALISERSGHSSSTGAGNIATATRAAASACALPPGELYGSEFYASASGSEFCGSEFYDKLSVGPALGNDVYGSGRACRGGPLTTHWPSGAATPENR